MSEMRTCATCGLEFETGWGSDEEYCNHCDEMTEYVPSGLSNPEEGDSVAHLHFSGTVVGVRARTLDGHASSVEVKVEKSSWGSTGGHVTIDTRYLSPV